MNMDITVEKDRLVRDLKNVARDAEDLMKATANEVGDKAREAREKLSAALASARESCADLEDKARAGAKATDKVIREHPYESIGVAFGVGVLLGVLLGRR